MITNNSTFVSVYTVCNVLGKYLQKKTIYFTISSATTKVCTTLHVMITVTNMKSNTAVSTVVVAEAQGGQLN